MDMKTEYSLIKERLFKTTMYGYYVLAAIVLLSEAIIGLIFNIPGYTYVEGGLFRYFVSYLVIPSLINFSVVILANIFVTVIKNKEIKDMILIATMVVICCTVSTVHSYFQMIMVVFVVPIVISLPYHSIRKTVYAFAMSEAAMVVSVLLSPLFDKTWSLETRLMNAFLVFILTLCVMAFCIIYIRYTQARVHIMRAGIKANREFTEKLKKDFFTGLYNHTEFYHELGECFDNFKENNEKFCLAIFDIDYFKKVNDIYGHENGNEVLLTLSAMLKDIFDGFYCARYGGEEFAVILPGVSRDGSYKLVEDLRIRFFNQKFDFAPGKHITISCGLYEVSEEDETYLQVFDKTDRAVYQAKSSGRNKTITYSVEVRS